MEHYPYAPQIAAYYLGGVLLTLCSALEVMALNDGAGNEYFSSNVGIQVLPATTALDVNGAIKIGTSNACDTTREGSQRYDSGTKSMQFCDGTGWRDFGSTGRSSSFYVHRAAADPVINITRLTPTIIDWTVEDYDYNDEFNLSTNRFTPKEPGLYLVIVKAMLTSSTTGAFIDGRIVKNTTNLVAINTAGVHVATSLNVIVVALVYLNGDTDYVEGLVTHSDPSSIALNNDGATTYMMGVKVSD